MAIPLTGAGSLFVRLGHIFGGILDINALLGGTPTARVLTTSKWTTRLNTILGDYNGGTAQPGLVAPLPTQMAGWQATQLGFLQNLATMAQNTTITMANLDTPLNQQTLTAALVLLNSQMVGNSASIQQSTVAAGAQTNVGTPVGNPSIVLSIIRGDGLTLQTPFPETIYFTTTQDAQTGGATARQERLTATTPVQASSPLSYLFPLGSGITQQFSLVDSMLSNTSGNMLVNSSFETWTVTNVPDNWNVITGTAGTDFKKDTGTIYGDGGAADLEFLGGTGVNTQLAQVFNTASSTVLNSGGTPAKVSPSSPFVATNGYLPTATGVGVPYCLSGFIKFDVSPAAGVLQFSLINAANSVINDDAATANTTALTISALTSSYAPFSAVFRLPDALPTSVKVSIKMSTALSGGSNVFLDSLSLTPMLQLYRGGPFLAGFAGSTKTLFADAWTRAITNTFGVNAQLLEQTMGLRNLGIQLPYSGSPTVADSLVL